MKILGIDFTSSPTKRKPIVLAHGNILGAQFSLSGLVRFVSHAQLHDYLAAEPAWVAGFDLPFALPRELLAQLAWPHEASGEKSAWQVHIEHLQTLSRADMVTALKQFCDARPAGGKFAHRTCDLPAGSSSSMKWVNPPVSFMLHAGAPVLLALGASLPGMHRGNDNKIALEAYPGFLARKALSNRSYKSDTKPKQTPEREQARVELVDALVEGRLGSRGIAYPALVVNAPIKEQLISDASGDCLDAVLCALQVAWGASQAHRNYGLPDNMDPLEGWIVSV